MSDLCAWEYGCREFLEVHPKTVKRRLTGDANAEKDKVAEALGAYVGKQTYKVDDESDAVAVGVAWLLEKELLEEIK